MVCADLKTIKVDGTGVTIGAMVTHAAVAASAEVRKAIPALAELAGGIGDQMVRNMGTLGGSIANADPAACYPAGLVGLDATVHTNQRTIAADAFFSGLYATALNEGELITAVHFPLAQKAAYIKFKQPASRFALVGVFVSQGKGGVRVAVTGAKASVFRASELEAALAKSFTPEAIKGGQAQPGRHQRRPARLGRLPRGDDRRDRRARGGRCQRALSEPPPKRLRRSASSGNRLRSGKDGFAAVGQDAMSGVPDSVDAVIELLASQDYVCDRRLGTALFLSLKLQRPCSSKASRASARPNWQRPWPVRSTRCCCACSATKAWTWRRPPTSGMWRDR